MCGVLTHNNLSNELTGFNLTVASAQQIISEQQKIKIAPEAYQRLVTSRAVVLQTTQPVYGMNTGVGQNKDLAIARQSVVKFNLNLVKSHQISIGRASTWQTSKLIMLIRISQLLQGRTGLNPEIVKLMVTLFNADVIPVFYEYGSIGEADIGVLSALAAVVMGQGKVWYHQHKVTTEKVFQQLQLQPIILGPKDALAILSANTFGVGQAITALLQSQALFKLAQLSLSLSMEGFDSNLTPISPLAVHAKHNYYQQTAAKTVSDYLQDSYLWQPHQRRQIQDPISFRSATHIFGAIQQKLDQSLRVIDVYLKGSDDNPVVDPVSGEIVSTGNFEILDVALALEALNLSLTHLSRTIYQRIKHLNNDQLTGLPRFLIQQHGAQFGLQTLQKTALDLDIRIRQMAQPVSNDFLGLAGDIEDHGSNLPLISESLMKINRYLRNLIAIEFYNAAQAVYLRFGDDKVPLGTRTQRVYQLIRHLIPPIQDDRPYNQEIEQLVAHLPSLIALAV